MIENITDFIQIFWLLAGGVAVTWAFLYIILSD
jgi:hypothetical protein